MGVVKKYWDSVYVYVLLIIPSFCSCAGTYWTILKLIGWYPHVQWYKLVIFDVSQIIYMGLALYTIFKNKRESTYILERLKLIKGVITVILLIQYNLIMWFFPSPHVWECTFLFFVAIALFFDSKMALLNIAAYLISLFMAHMVNIEMFLPLDHENVNEVLAYRILMCILTSFCVMVVVYFAERFLMKAWESDEENASLLEKQLHYYKDLELLDEEIRKFRHDVKNHFICMESLLDSGKTDELRQYFMELQYSFMTQKRMFVSGNDTVDAIMHYELLHSCKQNVNICVYGGLKEIKTVSAIDICTVFSNMLSNAISAVNKCHGENIPWLELNFSSGKNYFLIKITNSISEEFKEKKEDRDRNHGYGISKIKSVVQKYNGNYELKVDNEKVTVSVYLPI